MATGTKTSAFVHTLTNEKSSSFSLAAKFNQWIENLEPARFMVLAALLLIQGCVIAPAALLVFSNITIGLTSVGVAVLTFSTFAVLVSNLVLAPLKVIVITFALNLIFVLSLIGIHLIHLL